MSEFENDVKIDPGQLDVEWLEQSMLFRKYSDLKAEASKAAKMAHEHLKTVRSELRLEAAEGGKELLGVKDTNDNIDAWVRSHPRYKEAKQEQIEAEFEYEMLDGAVFAFHQRKAALENLVSLLNANYFAKPREPRDIEQEYSVVEQARNKTRKRASEKAKRVSRKRRKE